MKPGYSESAAVRAHLLLADAVAEESRPASIARRAISVAFAYLIAAPLLLVQNASADDGHAGDRGSAVVKGSSGPGAGPEDDEHDDHAAGADVHDNDDGVKNDGTSANGQESLHTTGGVQSTRNQDGDNTDGLKDAGTSAGDYESAGTTYGQQSTNNQDGDNTDGEPDNGTSGDGGPRAAKAGETLGTTGGQSSSCDH